jgi:hypothetical protein
MRFPSEVMIDFRSQKVGTNAWAEKVGFERYQKMTVLIRLVIVFPEKKCLLRG